MYKEIHPFFFDSATSINDVHSGLQRNEKEYYKPGLPRVIRLEDIRQIVPQTLTDNTVGFTCLEVSDDYHDNILVSVEEGEQIKNTLLKSSGDTLAKEVQLLTAAVRDLWNLLRARMR